MFNKINANDRNFNDKNLSKYAILHYNLLDEEDLCMEISEEILEPE